MQESKWPVGMPSLSVPATSSASRWYSCSCSATPRHRCHAKACDLAQFTILDDILVAAAGCPNLIVGPMVKAGAFVIDVCINRLPCGRLDRRSRVVADHYDGQPLCHSAASLLVRCDLALASDCARNLGSIDVFRRHGGHRRKIAQSGNGRSIPDSGNRSCAHHAEGPVPVVSWQRQKWQRAMRGET